MDHSKRDERIRLLVARLNKERKKQAAQIDILCNDIIAAQRQFIKALASIGFAADFYEVIAGLADLNELLYAAGTLIRQQVPESSVAFFLVRPDNFELHISESEDTPETEGKRLENCFTTELVSGISRANRICSLDDMFALGLEGSPSCLERFSAYTVPLSDKGKSQGFILVYRSAKSPLTSDELKRISSITCGLCRSVAAARGLVSAVR